MPSLIRQLCQNPDCWVSTPRHISRKGSGSTPPPPLYSIQCDINKSHFWPQKRNNHTVPGWTSYHVVAAKRKKVLYMNWFPIKASAYRFIEKKFYAIWLKKILLHFSITENNIGQSYEATKWSRRVGITGQSLINHNLMVTMIKRVIQNINKERQDANCEDELKIKTKCVVMETTHGLTTVDITW